MRRHQIFVLAAISAVMFTLAGCASDSTGPKVPDVSGTWTLSLTNMSGGGISCSSASGTTMMLSQSGTTFSGTYSGGTVICIGGGSSVTGDVGTGVIVNGAVNGDTVSFQIDGPDVPATGTISGDSMSGTATLSYNVVDPFGRPYVVVLVGSWGAVKRSRG